MLVSFHDAANIVVVGATGGIGGALVRALSASGRAARVFALSRHPRAPVAGNVTNLTVDITDDAALAAVAGHMAEAGPLDLVIVATGLLHSDGTRPIAPERRLADIDAGAMLEVLRVNTVGPALVAKHLLPHMRRDHKSVFAALSARVGSIGDNRLGGWVSYRASKAALNMVLKTLAIEHGRTRPQCVVAGLHPGTVATDLSAPFSGRVPEGKLFTAEQAGDYLLNVIDDLGPEDSGHVFAWDGRRIEP